MTLEVGEFVWFDAPVRLGSLVNVEQRGRVLMLLKGGMVRIAVESSKGRSRAMWDVSVSLVRRRSKSQ